MLSKRCIETTDHAPLLKSNFPLSIIFLCCIGVIILSILAVRSLLLHTFYSFFLFKVKKDWRMKLFYNSMVIGISFFFLLVVLVYMLVMMILIWDNIMHCTLSTPILDDPCNFATIFHIFVECANKTCIIVIDDRKLNDCNFYQYMNHILVHQKFLEWMEAHY